MTRGLRNNNPLNIRRIVGTIWQGQLAEQRDKKFVQFKSIEWGIRAACCILKTYQRKYKYVETVCRLTGFGGKERLAESQLPALVCAMAFVECGALISKETINKAYSLYVKLKSNSK